MQTTTSRYNQLAQGYVRPLSWALRLAFTKVFDDDVDFFTLDTSTLDSSAVLAPSDSNVIQEWDKYEYDDYTDRIIAMEWQREEMIPYSVTQAMADVTLNNYDGYFTRGASSPIDTYLLPRRPLRLLAGFGTDILPQFVGLTESVPVIDRKSRLATLHCTDFLSFLFDKPLDQGVLYQDVYTHEVLDNLFQLFGLLPAQYVLDDSFNTIAFVYFEKGDKLGDIVKKLMQAELGALFMDEFGIIRFRNRVKSSTSPVYTFNSSNVIDYEITEEDNIINSVEIKANVREVQARQPVFTLNEKIALPASTSTEVFFNFEDPVTTLDTIEFYTANSLEDGTGTDLTANITVTDTDLFSTAVKVTFANSGANAYLTALTLYGTPAKVTRNIYLREQDDDSVNKFEERLMTIENDFIQSESAAESLALSILNYYKDFSNTIEIQVKGNYALQIGDNVNVDIDEISETFTITKISNQLLDNQFKQRLTGKIFNIPSYFVLDESILDGDMVLAP